MLNRKFFLKEGPITRDRYRKHIFEDAKDIDDKKFPNYTKTKFSKLYGERKRANKFKRQASKYANSTAPVLTGDLLRDFSLIKVSDTGFQIGWSAFGARVGHLADKDRVLTKPTKALPTGVVSYLSKQAHKYIGKRLGKSKTTIHKIGKK